MPKSAPEGDSAWSHSTLLWGQGKGRRAGFLAARESSIFLYLDRIACRPLTCLEWLRWISKGAANKRVWSSRVSNKSVQGGDGFSHCRVYKLQAGPPVAEVWQLIAFILLWRKR